MNTGFEVPNSAYPQDRVSRKAIDLILGTLLAAPLVVMGVSEAVTQSCNVNLLPSALCAANTAFQHTVVDMAMIAVDQIPDVPSIPVGNPVGIG